MLDNIKADIKSWEARQGPGVLKFICQPMFLATVLIRLSRWMYMRRLPLLSYILVRLNDLLHGIWVGPKVEIGPGFFLGHSRGLMINPTTKIGANCSIMNSVTLGGPNIVIEDNVFIGAGAVVVKDVPSQAVMVGNPARNIRESKQ